MFFFQILFSVFGKVIVFFIFTNSSAVEFPVACPTFFALSFFCRWTVSLCFIEARIFRLFQKQSDIVNCVSFQEKKLKEIYEKRVAFLCVIVVPYFENLFNFCGKTLNSNREVFFFIVLIFLQTWFPGLTSQRHSALISSNSEYFQVCFSAVHYLKISEQRWFRSEQRWKRKFSELKISAETALFSSETELIQSWTALIFSETALKLEIFRAKNQRSIRAVSALIFSETELIFSETALKHQIAGKLRSYAFWKFRSYSVLTKLELFSEVFSRKP